MTQEQLDALHQSKQIQDTPFLKGDIVVTVDPGHCGMGVSKIELPQDVTPENLPELLRTIKIADAEYISFSKYSF